MKLVIGLAFTTSLCVTSVAFAQQTTEQQQVTRTESVTTTTPSGVPATTSTTTSYASETYIAPVDVERRTYWSREIGAPRDAFEIGVNTGYTQGFGNLGENRSVRDVAGPGMGVGLSLGYRASPSLSLGIRGNYQELSPSSNLTNARARGMLAGLDMTYHFTPYDRVDVWGSLGAGYRLLWDLNGREDANVDTTTATPRTATNADILRHGFELGRLELGFDIRVSRSVGIGPVIGADINMLLWRDENRGEGSVMMDSRGLTTFVYGGLQGRFDIGGDRVDKWTNPMARR